MSEEVLEHRVTRIETDVTEIKNAVKSIAESLRTLALLEMHHVETRDGLHRAFTEIEKIERRIRDIEINMPTLKLTSGWVIAGLLAAAGALGAGVVTIILR